MKLRLTDKSKEPCSCRPELNPGHSKGSLFPEETYDPLIKTSYRCINQGGHIHLIHFKSTQLKSNDLLVQIQNK